MRRGLQIVLAILSFIPLAFALIGVVGGAGQFLPDGAPAALDNQYRYLSAFYLSLTGLLWWVIPNIERHAAPVRILCSVIFLGGLARLVSHLTVGPGQPEQFAGMILELAVIGIIPWQGAVARQAQPGT